MGFATNTPDLGAIRRLRIWYGLIAVVLVVFGIRLFYLQIIRYDHYHAEALQQQFKDYQIPAERGLIEAHDGGKIVPVVLNQTLYTLYADPKFIKNAHADAEFVAGIIGGDVNTYETAMKQPNRYDVLAKKLTEDQKSKLMAAKKPGLDVQPQVYRTYPDGDSAAQVLGFVDDNGQGKYGIEQVLNSQLAGKPGLLKAITDAQGVPLPANKNNVQIPPTAGKDVVLTLDMSMQSQVENILKQGLQKAHSKAGSAIVMDPNTGAILAMANYPFYDPSQYYNVTDPSVFNNQAVADEFEPGSVMKILMTSTALDQGTIQPDTTYQDSGAVTVDGFTIRNVEPLPSSTVSIKEVLELSLNTGAVHMLKTLGGGDINSQARNIWHDYMANHFQLGKPTGIEQSYEASGSVPDPNKGYALNLKYANTAFGQGVSVTTLQMVSALSSIVNGGTYYQPHLVDGYMDSNGNLQSIPPKVVRKNVIKPSTAPEVEGLMEYVFTRNHYVYNSNVHPGFIEGGKTGTAQVASGNGGYSDSKYNGTFYGFVGIHKPQYTMMVFMQTPNLPNYEYAGTEAAPIFGSIADMLINNGYVTQ